MDKIINDNMPLKGMISKVDDIAHHGFHEIVTASLDFQITNPI